MIEDADLENDLVKVHANEVKRDPLTDRGTIMIVDDESVVRQVLRHHLVPQGYRVIDASSGAQALELLESEDIDLVLLEIMMPRMTGYEVRRAIREASSRDELPVIFLSAKDRQQDRVAGFDVGANDYLAKPIGKSELLARVDAHLELLVVHRGKDEEVRELRGLLPICSYCKKIRVGDGYWSQLEVYSSRHSEAAQFSHGICPGCLIEHHPNLPVRRRETGARHPVSTHERHVSIRLFGLGRQVIQVGLSKGELSGITVLRVVSHRQLTRMSKPPPLKGLQLLTHFPGRSKGRDGVGGRRLDTPAPRRARVKGQTSEAAAACSSKGGALPRDYWVDGRAVRVGAPPEIR